MTSVRQTKATAKAKHDFPAMSGAADSYQSKASDDKVTHPQDDRRGTKDKKKYGDSGFARMTGKDNGKDNGKDSGDGNSKNNGNYNGRSRFPSGMTKKDHERFS